MTVTNDSKQSKSTKEWQKIVYDWLAEEGMFRKEIEDAKSVFHFSLNYPIGSPYHIDVVKPRDMKDGILVVAILRVAPSHRTALGKLSPEKRTPLIHDLRMVLLNRPPGFSVKENDGVWDAVQFQVRVLYDTLSKTRLLEAIDEVFRSMLTVIWTFGHHFGIPKDNHQPGFYA